MYGSNRDPEYPNNESDEGLDPEESAHSHGDLNPFDEFLDAPDLSDDPSESESESSDFFDWDDLFETIPYWSADSQPVHPQMDFKDPDFEALEFEGFDSEDLDVYSHPLKGRKLEEDYLAFEGTPKRTQKRQPVRTREKAAMDPAWIKRLERAMYASGASAGKVNALVHPSDPRKNAGNSYASADLVEARQFLYYLALAAKSARTANEASGLASTLIPVAMRLYPQVNRGLWPALPALAASTSWLAREFFARPQSRSLITWLPKILESTLDSLAQRVRAGRPVTSRYTAALFARRVASLLVELDHLPQPDQRRQDTKPGTGQNGRG